MDFKENLSQKEDLINKYGNFFSISAKGGTVSGLNFFDRKNGNIIRYKIKENSIETYKLNDMKERARDILKIKGFEIEKKATPNFISSKVLYNRHKYLDKVNDKTLAKSLYRNDLINYGEMAEEEKNIINSIPQDEMMEILFPDVNNSIRFDLWMEILHKNPMEMELLTINQLMPD